MIILLILAGTAGYLYYTVVKAPLELDDPQKLAASVPMSPEDRFEFFPADRTAQVTLDKADLWSVILTHAGDDFLDVVNKEISHYGLSVSGCAIQMEEEGLQLNLELFYRETRLVAKVPCNLTIDGQKITLTPTAVKLGVIKLPVGALLSSLKLEYSLSLPVLTEVAQVSIIQDAILLTGPVEQDIRTLVPLDAKLYQTAVFSDSLQSLADNLQTDAGFDALMSRLEQDPGSAENLYRDLFTMADPEITASYQEERAGLIHRFFPGIDFSAVDTAHTALSDQVTTLNRTLEQFFTAVVNDYNEKEFRLSGGEFLKKKKPFQAAGYAGGQFDTLFEVLDPESVFLILVDAEDGFIRKTSSFYRMCDENQEFTQEVDFNKTYILGCVLRSVDGDPFLMYETEIEGNNTYTRKIALVPLTEEDIIALQVPGKFGVWTG